MGWVVFLFGSWFGCAVGIFIMCLVQVNRINREEQRIMQKQGIGQLKSCKCCYVSPEEQLSKIETETKELKEIIQDIKSSNVDRRNHVCEECIDVIVACITLLDNNFSNEEINNMSVYVNYKNKERGYY